MDRRCRVTAFMQRGDEALPRPGLPKAEILPRYESRLPFAQTLFQQVPAAFSSPHAPTGNQRLAKRADFCIDLPRVANRARDLLTQNRYVPAAQTARHRFDRTGADSQGFRRLFVRRTETGVQEIFQD